MPPLEGEQIERLARQHRPVLYLHPDEKYLPLEFSRYVDAAQLKQTSTGQIVKPDVAFSAVTFGQWLQDEPALNSPDYTLFLPQGMNSALIAQYRPDAAELATVPLYAHARQTAPGARGESHLFVSYSHLYAYNGPESVCGFGVGAHFADIEHVTADFFLSRHGDVTLDRLYTSRHNGGVWVPSPELMWLDGGTRPVVFSSLNGHASYTAPGKFRRYWGVAVDRCDYGLCWNPDALVFLPPTLTAANETLKWTLFRGDLGDGSVSGFGNKSYLVETEVDEEYGASLVPCKWRL